MTDENRAMPGINAIEFIRVMHNLIYTARIHKDNNRLIKECLVKFKAILDEMTKEGDFKLQLWRGRFHIDGEKLRAGRESQSIINEMVGYLSERGIGAMQFSITSSKASFTDIMTLIRLIDLSIKNESPFEWLKAKFPGYSLEWVDIQKKKDDEHHGDESGEGYKRKKKAKTAYMMALDTVKDVAEKASKGVAGVLKARRLAQNIVDLIHEDRSLILGLATIHEYDDYTYTHSVNVSLLATCLGKQIGLSNVVLEHLSVCGLFHDLGKVGVPRDIILKQGALNNAEWDMVQSHPLLGVKRILRLNADKELRSKIILGPFEHHLNPDMTGYPKTHFMKKLSLSGRILRIVDVYEALTADRKYRKRSFTPDEALRKMWSEGEKSFDMVLLKHFVRMMGIFPIGSAVELSDGRFAIIMDYPDGPLAPATIMLLEKDSSGTLLHGEVKRLSGGRGYPGVSIKMGVIPSSIGVSVAELLLS
ncbi:MAG: HD domain-containing protein [Deltaproteobacteria bacterium]|nr:HD domain-containing protein [Deltaproteobacteria bacterium]